VTPRHSTHPFGPPTGKWGHLGSGQVPPAHIEPFEGGEKPIIDPSDHGVREWAYPRLLRWLRSGADPSAAASTQFVLLSSVTYGYHGDDTRLGDAR
jgi:hypothetical protein